MKTINYIDLSTGTEYNMTFDFSGGQQFSDTLEIHYATELEVKDIEIIYY